MVVLQALGEAQAVGLSQLPEAGGESGPGQEVGQSVREAEEEVGQVEEVALLGPLLAQVLELAQSAWTVRAGEEADSRAPAQLAEAAAQVLVALLEAELMTRWLAWPGSSQLVLGLSQTPEALGARRGVRLAWSPGYQPEREQVVSAGQASSQGERSPPQGLLWHHRSRQSSWRYAAGPDHFLQPRGPSLCLFAGSPLRTLCR